MFKFVYISSAVATWRNFFAEKTRRKNVATLGIRSIPTQKLIKFDIVAQMSCPFWVKCQKRRFSSSFRTQDNYNELKSLTFRRWLNILLRPLYNCDRTAWTLQLWKYSLNITTEKGQPEHYNWERTAWTLQLRKDSLNITNVTGQPKHDNCDRTARTEQPEQVDWEKLACPS